MAIEYRFEKNPVPFFIGYTDVDEDMRAVNEELYREGFDPEKFPFHNIYKEGALFIVDIHVPSYTKDELDINIENDIMTVVGKQKDDRKVYEKDVYKGYDYPNQFTKHFRLADNILLHSIDYFDGVLTIRLEKQFVEIRQGKYTIGHKHGDIPLKPKKEELKPVVVNVNEEKKDVPTTAVVVIEPMPQVVEVKVEKNLANVSEPIVVLQDATKEVSDNVDLVTVPTESGKSDIVVAIDPAIKADMANKGVDVIAVVKDAIEKFESAPSLPEAPKDVPVVSVTVENEKKEPVVEVKSPEVVTQIVEIKKDESAPKTDDVPAVVVSDTSEKVSNTAVLVPVVTKEGQPDIVAAIEPELKKELEDKGVDVTKDLGTALQDAQVEVVTNNEVKVEEPVAVVLEPAPVVVEPGVKVDPANTSLAEPKVVVDEPKIDLIVPKVEEPVAVAVDEVKVPDVVPVAVEAVVVNAAPKDSENVVKAEVVALDPMPQVVSVELDKGTIVLKDATVEVKDNVDLVTVPTEAGKSDVVVAIEPVVAKELVDKGIDVVEAVKNAVVAADVAPSLPPTVDAEIKVPTSNVEVKHASVVVPDVVTQIVEVSKDTNTGQLVMSDVSEKVPSDAVMVPVITPEGQPDIVAAVTPEVAKEFTDKNVDVSKTLSDAVIKAEVIVDTVVPADVPVAEVKVEEVTANVTDPVAANVNIDLTKIEVPKA